MQMVGLCTGLLAAAAIICSQTITKLLSAATKAVIIAFQTGLRTMGVRDRIERTLEDSSSWFTLLSGIDEGKASIALEQFCEAKVGKNLLPYEKDENKPDRSCPHPNRISAL